MNLAPSISAASLRGAVERLKDRRVLVVGDVILDRYIWGEVDRVSPEAPVPVVQMTNQTLRLGGAANVISNLAALGARAELVGVIGDDDEADRLRSEIQELGLNAAGLIRAARRPTTVKTRILSMGQQLLRLDSESTNEVDGAIAERLLARTEKALKRCEVVILSDYLKGVLNAETCPRLITMARRAGVPIIVDPKGIQYQKYAGATIIKPNQKEAEAAAAHKIDGEAALIEAGRKIQRLTRARAVVITRGEQGVMVFERRRAPVPIPTHTQAVYDVTGAGDTFVAVMGAALATGAAILESASLGNVAGSIVVGKLGASTVTPAELLEAF